ncbi:MAG: hypothetical protein L0Y54_21825 [Sporichthyaceae bacterium]|nr:hypothetical protein [Sporichthyaceae bacterium]
MDGFTIAWLLWVGFFGAIEGAALANKQPGDTLSEHLWRWFAITGKPAGWRARRAVLVAGLAWLVAHLLSGGRF